MMQHQLDSSVLRKRLDKTAAHYAQHAAIQREVAKRVLTRLDYIKYKPKYILDLSLHPNDSEVMIRKHFPKACYIAATNHIQSLMLRKRKIFDKPKSIQVVFEQLPIKSNSIDFIFINLSLTWTDHWPQLLCECQRMLMPKGMLLFTSFGPDSLCELRQAFLNLDQKPHVHQFVDMHDIGDALIQAGFKDPVMDMEHMTLHYQTLHQLTDDLRLTAAQNAHVNRSRGLMTPRQWACVTSAYSKQQHVYPATFELIFGHAWAGDTTPQRQNELGEISVSLDALRRCE